MTPVPTIIIQGITPNGRSFRPSDWAERLSGVMSTVGEDRRMSYSPYVQPLTVNGIKSVSINTKLREVDARAFDFFIDFARSNGLKILDGAGTATAGQ